MNRRMQDEKIQMLHDKLKVGAKIKYGKEYAEFTGGDVKAGEVITLVDGYFEYDNGLYCETKTAPSIWDEDANEFESIYHMFGNDLQNFLDCEVID